MNSRSKLRFRMEIGGVCAQISRLTRTCANRVASVAEEEKAKQENLPVNLAESQLSENLGQDIENLEAILESLDNISEELGNLKDLIGFEDTEEIMNPSDETVIRPAGYEKPGRKKREARMAMVVTDELRDRIKRASSELGVSINEIINVALQREMDRVENR